LVFLRYKFKEIYEKNPAAKKAIDERCENDPVYWINHFAVTHDPRLIRFGINPKVPFILYPSQEYLVKRVHKSLFDGTKLLVEKSRGEGATETLCAYTTWAFAYQSDCTIGWGSRTKYQVDLSDNPNTIFERIRRIIRHLPKNMIPGYSKKNDKTLRIINPYTKSVIYGSGGKDIGRGDRATQFFVDEFTTIEDKVSALSGMSDTAFSNIIFSTPMGRDKFFEEKNVREVITMAWYYNPAKNLDWIKKCRPEKSWWYENEKMSKDEATIKQEVDISYDAFAGSSMIPMEWINAAISLHTKIENMGYGVNRAGFDIAASGQDKNVYQARTGRIALKPKEIQGVSTPLEAARRVARYAEEDYVDCINYDENAYGEDVQTEMGKEFPSLSWKGIKGQRSPTDRFLEDDTVRACDKFMNLRGEVWYSARKAFERTYQHVNRIKIWPVNKLISIPDDNRLINELSQPLMLIDSGKIGVESKRAMRARKIKSPNFADAFVYCFFDDGEAPLMSGSFNYKASAVSPDVIVDPNRAIEIFGSIYCPDDINVFTIAGSYDRTTKSIRIVYASKTGISELDYINSEIKDVCRNLQVNNWFAPEKIIKTCEDGTNGLFYKLRKKGIRPSVVYLKDLTTVYSVIENLFKHDRLLINSELDNFVNNIRNWKIDKGKPVNDLPYVNCLLLFMSGLLQNRMRKMYDLE